MKRISAGAAALIIAGFMVSLGPANSALAAPKSADASSAGQFDHFTPRPATTKQIYYEQWDSLLENIILYMGPSTRQKYTPPPPVVGSRVVIGNKSPVQMEGNKVLYPRMRDNTKLATNWSLSILIEIGNRGTVPTLPRNEQLAYWINLHNNLVVNSVAKHYPGPRRRPEKITPVEGSKDQLHDAKIVTIDGVPLSLRDIREKIVYPNWKNPDVPLAFYLGDAGGPQLANVAYSGHALRAQLKKNADEYVNSLRGMDQGKVSRVFHDVAPWYFPNFEADLQSYFQSRMREEVFSEYAAKGYRGEIKYDKQVNDITGGRGKRGPEGSAMTRSTKTGSLIHGPNVTKFLRDRDGKFVQLQNQDWFNRGTVTIVDEEVDNTTEVE